MSEHEFLEEVRQLYLKMKRIHTNTVKVIVIVSGVMFGFMSIIIVQGFATTRQAAELTSKVEMVDDTQVIMNQLDEYRAAIFDKQIGDVKENISSTKAELQRQLDLLMKDRKMVERGLVIGDSTDSMPKMPGYE